MTQGPGIVTQGSGTVTQGSGTVTQGPGTIDPCDSNPCLNGGTCASFTDRYECNCPEDWSGTNCEVGRYRLKRQSNKSNN